MTRQRFEPRTYCLRTLLSQPSCCHLFLNKKSWQFWSDKKKEKRPYWMNNFSCILHILRKITSGEILLNKLKLPFLRSRKQVWYHSLLSSFFSIFSQVAKHPRFWPERGRSKRGSKLGLFAPLSQSLLTMPLSLESH